MENRVYNLKNFWRGNFKHSLSCDVASESVIMPCIKNDDPVVD